MLSETGADAGLQLSGPEEAQGLETIVEYLQHQLATVDARSLVLSTGYCS
jgi:hypothetical protein